MYIPHRIPIVGIVGLCLCLPLFAFQAGSLRLKTGRLLDGRGGILYNATIEITEGKITAVTDSQASTVDLSDYTVMPGLIDTHDHFSWHFDSDGQLHDASREEESVTQSTLLALENAYLTLIGGITTVQSLGSPLDRDVRDLVARGILPGPRILTSLQAINQRTGSPEEIRRVVAERKSQGADVIKIFGSASIRVGGAPTLTQEQLDAACGEARAQGLRSAVHAHGAESARRAVLAGCTVIEHGALLDRATLELMAEQGTFYDPHIGLIFQNYFDNEQRYLGISGYTEEGFSQMRQAVPKALEVFKMALAVDDLKIVFGTDAVAGAHGRNVEELIYRVKQGGQHPMQAILSATSGAADSLGLGESLGRIETGFEADLIAVDGDPLSNIEVLRKVVFVMKGGAIYRMPER